MDAIVIIKTTIKNVCSQEDLDDTKMSFREMVIFLANEDGLCSVLNDDAEIISVKEITCT